MVEDGKKKSGADWKAPQTGDVAGDQRVSLPPIQRDRQSVVVKLPVEEPVNDEVSGGVQFFDVPQDPNRTPLADDDLTPVVQMVRSRNTVTEIDQDEVQRRLREAQKSLAASKYEGSRNEMREKELADIFEAVKNGDEDLIKGLISRQFGVKNFSSLEEFKDSMREFISGDQDHSMILDLNKPQVYDATMEISFRPRIGEYSPTIIIKLANKSGLGKSQGEKQTSVLSMEINNPPMPVSPEPKRSLLDKLFGKKTK